MNITFGKLVLGVALGFVLGQTFFFAVQIAAALAFASR